MFIVKVMNTTNNKIFTKEFNDRKQMLMYARKVKYSKVLALLSVVDNSKFYD